MNKFSKIKSFFSVLVLSIIIASCSSDDSNDGIITPPDGGVTDTELIVTESGVGDKRNVNVTGGAMGEDIRVNVKFESPSNSMRRLYITQNVGGLGDEPYEISTTGVTVDDKKDGSLDLSGDLKNAFDFTIDFPAPSSMDNGTIVYTLWATSGRGDFRDVTKRNVFDDDAIGTITVTFGTGTNAASGFKTFTGVKLFAPRGDYKSDTFLSAFNGTVYEITDGLEFIDLWDFGYFSTPVDNQNASLASPAGWALPGVDLNDFVTGAEQGDTFNAAHFKESVLLSSEFDGITNISQFITSVSTQDPQVINNLSQGDVVEFIDQYGNIGLIKITQIFLGASGNGFDADAFITMDIKIAN